MSVDAYGYQVRKYSIKNDDDSYSYLYDAKYEYEVDGDYYCFYSYEDSYVSNKIKIYYNPSNPQEYSYYATYKDAVRPVKYIKIIGYLFFGVSIILLLIILYFKIFKKEYIYNDNYIIAEDNVSLDIDKEYIIDEYGVWDADDENYVDVDTRLNRTVVQVPDKEVVDKIATIKFEKKHNTDISADSNDKNI